MHRKIAVCLGAALFLVIAISESYALTGAELYQFCTQARDSSGYLSCNAYVRGFADGIFLADIMAGKGKRLCTPVAGSAIEHTQARLIIEKYLRNHPEFLHEQAGYLAALALYDAFECKNGDSMRKR
jgi:hypothetical protein